MANNAREIILTQPQKLWLEAICSKLRKGEHPKARILKVELLDKLPRGFDPSKIDSKLLRGSDKITPLGIAAVDPTNDLVTKSNEVIKSIRQLLKENPEIDEIHVKHISPSTGIPEAEVAAVFEQLSFIGVFHNSGTNFGTSGWGTIRIDDRTLDAYLKYESLEQMLEDIVEIESDVQKRGAENLDTQAVSTLLKNYEELLINNRYRILSTFPHSGFGQAFLAEDTHLPSKRKRVIKQFNFPSDNPVKYKDMLVRFEREAAILEKLAESNEQIPDLHAHFSENGKFYLVQEWIEGETVAAKVAASGTLNETMVKDLVKSLLHILDYVHSRAIIHRDIKPENIILRDSDLKPFLIDFGAVKEIVHTIVDDYGNPSTSIVVGTPGFMPLEQVSGLPVFASDIYALGLSAIYMLTGKRPQELKDLRTGDFAWHQHAKDVSANFAAILDKAIQPNVRERFLEAKEMLAALDITGQDTLLQAQDELSKPDAIKETGSLITPAASLVSPKYATPNMPQLATQWLREFIKPLVVLVDGIKNHFNQNTFEVSASPIQPYSMTFIYRIDFFERQRWTDILTSDVGEYVLNRFPLINNALTLFETKMNDTERAVSKLLKALEDSPFFLKQLVDTYARMISHERVERNTFENSNLTQIAQLVLGQMSLQISHYPTEAKDTLVRFVAYSLLGLKIEFPMHSMTEDRHKLPNIASGISSEINGKDEKISTSLEETKGLFEVIKSESSDLHTQLKRAQMDIVDQFGATF